MTLPLRALLLASPLLLSACATPTLQVPEPTAPLALNPVAERLSDPALRADLAAMQALRSRLRQLNETGRPVDDYWLCKASAWLDMAFDEYTDNDRGPLPQAAFNEALGLIKAMEAGASPLPTDTPLLAGSPKVRPDLWAFADQQKAQGGTQNCAACDLAKLEVHTVWIGHEYQSLGWRLAEPEILAAERYQRAINSKLAAGCPSDTAPLLAPSHTPPEAACPIQPLKECPQLDESVPDRVHFAFNQARISKVTARVLRHVLQALEDHPAITVRLDGQADMKGTVAYNQKLAWARSEAVRRYLEDAGIAPNRIKTAARGAVAAENNDLGLAARATMRTVTFSYYSAGGLRIVPQKQDVQADK